MGFSNQEGLKKSYALPILIQMVLVDFGLAFAAYSVYQHGASFNNITAILIYLVIVYYSFEGYKIPHGNLLKYTILLFAVIASIFAVVNEDAIGVGCYGVAIASALCAYMGGRLNRLNENKIISVVCLVLFLIASIIALVSIKDTDIVEKILMFALPIQWGAISMSYFTKYYLHKEAGMADKK